MKLTINEGRRLKVDGEWKHAGDTVSIADDYEARVLIESGVASPAKAASSKR